MLAGLFALVMCAIRFFARVLYTFIRYGVLLTLMVILLVTLFIGKEL